MKLSTFKIPVTSTFTRPLLQVNGEDIPYTDINIIADSTIEYRGDSTQDILILRRNTQLVMTSKTATIKFPFEIRWSWSLSVILKTW